MASSRILASALEVAAQAGRALEHVLLPNACAFCGDDLPIRRPPVCDGCHADMPWIPCRFHLDPFSVAVAPLEYSFPVDAAIKRFKFRRKLFYAPAFRYLLKAAVCELPDDIEAVLPMPLHWRRQALRGFNQAAEIAGGVGREAGIPVIGGVRRTRHTPYQSGLTAAQRRRNIRRAFRVEAALRYQHVLVIDDVITTGETCRELARVLLGAGIESVSALAIARSGPG